MEKQITKNQWDQQKQNGWWGYWSKCARGVGGSGWEMGCLNWESGGVLAGDDKVKSCLTEER